MEDRNVLVVEDYKELAIAIKDMLEYGGYNVTLAPNGKEALDIFNKTPFLVVLTDIEMPVMDGHELTNHLTKMPYPPVVIITSVKKDPQEIIDIMKKGVFDYLIKPVDMDDLRIKIKRAFDAAEMKRTLAIMEKERILRLENQLDWFKWEEKVKRKNVQSIDKSLFSSLQRSFSQGSGFGSLITFIQIIISSAREQGNDYYISKDLFNMMIESSAMGEKALEIFRKIDNIITNKFELENSSISDLHMILEENIAKTRDLAEIKKHKVALSELKLPRKDMLVPMNREYFSEAFTELLVNAYKFSEENTKIMVLLEIMDKNVCINIINTPLMSDSGIKGIPMEYENIVFEPFYRLFKSLQEQYKTLDYGLGLTIVENIISVHNGKVSVSNITDHSDITRGPVTRVNFTVTLPLAAK
jgi:CheY-like chemotaxis protein